VDIGRSTGKLHSCRCSRWCCLAPPAAYPGDRRWWCRFRRSWCHQREQCDVRIDRNDAAIRGRPIPRVGGRDTQDKLTQRAGDTRPACREEAQRVASKEAGRAGGSGRARGSSRTWDAGCTGCSIDTIRSSRADQPGAPVAPVAPFVPVGPAIPWAPVTLSHRSRPPDPSHPAARDFLLGRPVQAALPTGSEVAPDGS